MCQIVPPERGSYSLWGARPPLAPDVDARPNPDGASVETPRLQLDRPSASGQDTGPLGVRMSPLAGHRIASLIVLAVAIPVAGQGYPPGQAPGKMSVPDGFAVKLVAAEPEVRQPVAIDFDDRGRLWVMQYLQYPNPAGLKRVKVDRYSRTVYDRVPEPPPKGPRGADRLTIIEADGAAHDFVAGLNL